MILTDETIDEPMGKVTDEQTDDFKRKLTPANAIHLLQFFLNQVMDELANKDGIKPYMPIHCGYSSITIQGYSGKDQEIMIEQWHYLVAKYKAGHLIGIPSNPNALTIVPEIVNNSVMVTMTIPFEF